LAAVPELHSDNIPGIDRFRYPPACLEQKSADFVRKRIALALKTIGSERAVDGLLARLEHEPNYDVRGSNFQCWWIKLKRLKTGSGLAGQQRCRLAGRWRIRKC